MEPGPIRLVTTERSGSGLGCGSFGQILGDGPEENDLPVMEQGLLLTRVMATEWNPIITPDQLSIQIKGTN